MTAVLAPAAAPRRAVRALTRVETARMVRHPVTVAAALLLVGGWAAAWFAIGTGRYPILQSVDRDSAIGVMLLLGGAALIVGNLAVRRADRDGTTGLSQVLILPDRARTAAHLIAPLPLAALGAVLIVARMAVLEFGTAAAGRPNPYELATGPAGVLLLGALGVLLGRLTRSAIVAPLALLVLLAGLAVTEALPGGGGVLWLAPQGAPATPMPLPVTLLGRPAAAHFGYLVGLAGLLAVAAVGCAGARGVRLAVAGSVALAGTVLGGAAQLPGPDPAVLAARAAAMNYPSRYETCRTLGPVTYCAFAGFGDWIPAWDAVVRAVLAQVPASARAVPLTVRQRFVLVGSQHGGGPRQLLDEWRADDVAAGTSGAIGVGTEWNDRDAAAALAGQVAYRLVTGRTGEAQVGPGAELAGAEACGGVGVLVAWLAGQSATGERLPGGSGDGISFDPNQLIPGVHVPAVEVAVATQLLDHPHADSAEVIQRSWTTLTAPGTTAAEAAAILGVAAPGRASDTGSDTGSDCR